MDPYHMMGVFHNKVFQKSPLHREERSIERIMEILFREILSGMAKQGAAAPRPTAESQILDL